MITSIPLLALKFGIGFKEYAEIANNIRRVSFIPKFARKEILERGDKGFSENMKKDINDLVYIMADDREIYKIAELNYSKGPPLRENLFVTALVDYILRCNLQYRNI